jgi:hypothetical protein
MEELVFVMDILDKSTRFHEVVEERKLEAESTVKKEQFI